MPATPSLRYAQKTDRNGIDMVLIGEWVDLAAYYVGSDGNGIDMVLIGEWVDLAAYYVGSDGNAWTFNATTGTWSNNGGIGAFRAHFAQRFRGDLFPVAGD